MDLNKTVGIQIRLHRKARGLTQEQLAEKCNLSVHHISGIERGIHSPSLLTLEHIASVLNVQIYEMFNISGKKKKGELDRTIDVLLKHLYKMKPSTVLFLTKIARKLKDT
jgi:transcriptional regulator with XRE-family HTH domain